jgi:hypothetical protein
MKPEPPARPFRGFRAHVAILKRESTPQRVAKSFCRNWPPIVLRSGKAFSQRKPNAHRQSKINSISSAIHRPASHCAHRSCKCPLRIGHRSAIAWGEFCAPMSSPSVLFSLLIPSPEPLQSILPHPRGLIPTSPSTSHFPTNFRPTSYDKPSVNPARNKASRQKIKKYIDRGLITH